MSTSAPGAGGDPTIGEERWRMPRASVLRGKKGNKETTPVSSQRVALAQLASCSKTLGKLWGSSEFACTMCSFVSQGRATNGSTLWKASHGNCALPVTS